MIKLLKADGAEALVWGGLGDGTPGSGLWTTTMVGEGQPFPWYYAYKAFRNYFAAGTHIYKTTISPPGSIEALASATKIMLVNKTANSISISVNDNIVLFSPYQVIVVNL
jgi:hypothetical protein